MINGPSDGVIKFECDWVKGDALSVTEFHELNLCRNELFKRNLIGVYPNGIGYGNLSCRKLGEKSFVISGSATGALPVLDGSHYTTVTDYSFEKNQLRCWGPIQASSESLSHAVVYETVPDALAVLHVHHRPLWESLMDKVPTTDKAVPYGTPEMASEIRRLLLTMNTKNERLVVMGGHEEGVIAFGRTLTEALLEFSLLF